MNILMKRRMCTSRVSKTQTEFEIKDMHMEKAHIWEGWEERVKCR